MVHQSLRKANGKEKRNGEKNERRPRKCNYLCMLRDKKRRRRTPDFPFFEILSPFVVPFLCVPFSLDDIHFRIPTCSAPLLNFRLCKPFGKRAAGRWLFPFNQLGFFSFSELHSRIFLLDSISASQLILSSLTPPKTRTLFSFLYLVMF